MTLDKDTLRSSHKYLSKAATHILPGMAILQMVFHKGLLSGNVHDISELVLLVVWSFVFSVPYFFLATIYMLWLGTPLEGILKGDMVEQSTDAYEETICLTVLLVLITLGSYKVMLWWNWPPFTTYLGIKREYVLCIASIGITMLISVPVAILYYRVLLKLTTSIALDKVRPKRRG